MNTSIISDFIGEYDKEKGEFIGDDICELDIDLTGIEPIETTIIKGLDIKERKNTGLLVVKVCGMEGDSPVFKLKPLSKKGEKLIKDTRKYFDRVFYIPGDDITTEYVDLQISFENNSIDGLIERLGQLVSGNIICGNLEQNEKNYRNHFRKIRRRLEQEKNISEMEAYIYIYRILSPYVGISTFLSLIDESGKYPNLDTYFSNTNDNIITEDFNQAFNELEFLEKFRDEFLLIRDSILFGFSNSNINGLVYPFSEK